MSEIRDLVVAEFERFGLPKSQEDCCAIAARADIKAHGLPIGEVDILERAQGLAMGLFGPAFAKADEHQQWIWIDMCERALRAALP